MDNDKIKKALDHFEYDEFVDAKEILTKEIKSKRDEFVKDKVGLKDDISTTEKKKDDKEE